MFVLIHVIVRFGFTSMFVSIFIIVRLECPSMTTSIRAQHRPMMGLLRRRRTTQPKRSVDGRHVDACVDRNDRSTWACIDVRVNTHNVYPSWVDVIYVKDKCRRAKHRLADDAVDQSTERHVDVRVDPCDRSIWVYVDVRVDLYLRSTCVCFDDRVDPRRTSTHLGLT
jgi:hypothetical protein